jgi:CheY-like chemotaxis protein
LVAALGRTLRRPDYEIVACPDSGSAILFLKGNPVYHLLLFELEVRGSTALELAQLARSLSHRDHLPIVILTSNEMVGELEAHALNLPIAEWITKKDLPTVSQIIRLLELGTNELVAQD